jgi:acetolactate synthase-1/3 small subunit
MKQTISILVENHAGVLSRVSGLFARRGFNIDSLAVGITDNPAISRITIVVDGDDYVLEQVEKQLNKLIDVIKVRELGPVTSIQRETMLIKVKASAKTRGDILDVVRVTGAKICDVSTKTITVELCDSPDRLEILQQLLTPFGVEEIVRTGAIAIEKG